MWHAPKRICRVACISAAVLALVAWAGCTGRQMPDDIVTVNHTSSPTATGENVDQTPPTEEARDASAEEESAVAAPQAEPEAANEKPAAAAPKGKNPFPRRFPAPPLSGDFQWLNTDGPVDLKSLRGKFVVLDFWTYCCINCMHVLPELKKLEQAYPNNVVVIGVHSAKFETEQQSDSIRQAIMRYEIEHPVVNDAQLEIWGRYDCRSWPSLRVIDPEGYVVAAHSGEIQFAALDDFLQEKLPYYRANGLLDERPIQFALERDKAGVTPLRYPGKILVDSAGGRLFIADSNHNRIVVASLDGKLRATIGSGTIGHADGDFAAAQLNHPQGMTLHGDVLYVADTENHLLRKVDLKQQRVTTIAGTGAQARSGWPGFDPDAPSTSSGRFVGPPKTTPLNSPWALSIVRSDLYIAMAGRHQIWKMPLDESEIGPYAGNGREDIVDGPLLPPRPYEAGYASFAQPSGLASDRKWLYVADSEGSSVRAVPLSSGKEVTTVVGTSHLRDARLFVFGDVDGRAGRARLQHCLDVALDGENLYVADTYNHKIKVIDLKSQECKTLAGTGQPGNHDGPATSAMFFEPAGLTCADGKLYVADTNNHRIRVIELAGDNQVATLDIAGLEAPQPRPR